MRHLVEWDSIDMRIDGERIDAIAQSFRPPPIERLQLKFLNGVLRIEGAVRKFISVPFTVEVREIATDGLRLRVPLSSVQAFGGIPIPQFLFGLVRDQLPKEIVAFEPPATFVISLAGFLPEFVETAIDKIWIIEGGLAVTIGRGGADPPLSVGAPLIPTAGP